LFESTEDLIIQAYDIQAEKIAPGAKNNEENSGMDEI